MKQTLIGSAKLAAVFVAAFAVSAGATRLVRPTPPPPHPPPLKAVESFNFDAGMRRFGGALSARARAAVNTGESKPALVVVIRKGDVVTCEDLGRQLRELRRAYGSERTVTVLADTAPAVEAFVHGEHLARMPVRAIAIREVLEGGANVATPAVMVVEPGGRVLEGVSHTLRAPNARLRSFTQELRYLNAPAGADDGERSGGSER